MYKRQRLNWRTIKPHMDNWCFTVFVIFKIDLCICYFFSIIYWLGWVGTAFIVLHSVRLWKNWNWQKMNNQNQALHCCLNLRLCTLFMIINIVCWRFVIIKNCVLKISVVHSLYNYDLLLLLFVVCLFQFVWEMVRELICRSTCVYAVSYTHLDVYKRQECA